MDLLVKTLKDLGFKARKPRGSFFLYVAAPQRATLADGSGKSFAFPTAEAFSQWMITENLISTVPWDEVGAYVRFSVTFAATDTAEESRVVNEIGNRLGRYTFEW
jgi:LL-diaminopimelate aminotransferase